MLDASNTVQTMLFSQCCVVSSYRIISDEDKYKMKTMIIGRKQKKIDMRIKDESVEQVDSFKHLGCNISSNLNCCQEVKQRIAMAKEGFNRKRSIFCRTPGERTKEETSEVLCVECSVVWCRDIDTTTEWAKPTENIWAVDKEKDGAYKMDRQNKKSSCVIKSGRR